MVHVQLGFPPSASCASYCVDIGILVIHQAPGQDQLGELVDPVLNAILYGNICIQIKLHT